MSEHRIERSKAIEERGYKCEITSQTEAIEAHHVVPKYIDGPDNKFNYQLLQKDFHKKIHEVTWSDNPHLIVERSIRKGQVIRNPNNDSAKERIEEIDSIIVPEFIEKLMNDMPYQHREKLIQQTLVSNFHTIRDLNIQVMQLRKKLEEVLGEEIVNGNVVEFKKPKKRKRK